MLVGFRNWWEKSQYYFNNAIYGHWVQIGWKAALRWVLKDICSKYYGYGVNEIEKAIKEELKK